MEYKANVTDKSGKIINIIFDGDRILRKKSIISYKENIDSDVSKISLRNNNLKFCKLWSYTSAAIANGVFTQNEIKIIMYISTSLKYNTNLIVDGSGKSIDLKTISEIMNIKQRTLDKLLISLIQKEVLYKVKLNKSYLYYANPYFISNSVSISKEIVMYFNDTIWFELFNGIDTT